MEFLFELLAEFFLQLLFQAVVELGFHGFKDTFKANKNPFFSTIGFVVWGLIAGGISLWPAPHAFIADHNLRLANLFVTPFVVGGVMWLIGRLRVNRGQALVGLDHFGYAFIFAFAMALFRFKFTS
jgi:hypothetical protein